MGARLEEIGRQLSRGGAYLAEPEDGVLYIRELDSSSEYNLELFGDSAQIRQGVQFDCDELPADELSRILLLCSMMNARFSGCKSYVDQWGVLLTTADILGPDLPVDFIETVLNQIEFISLAMLGLLELMERQGRIVTEAEIEAALEVPSLQ
jgi:hypothetical protein